MVISKTHKIYNKINKYSSLVIGASSLPPDVNDQMKYKSRRFPARETLRLIGLFGAMILTISEANAQRQMEKLGRGVIALRTGTSSAYVGWRLLATDPESIGFNVLRSVNGGAPVQINTALVTNTTDYADTTVNFANSNSWFIQPVIGTVTQALSAPWGQPTNAATRQYFSVPLHAVTGGAYPPYDVKFCWVGDLDGDGEYDFVVDRLSTSATSSATNNIPQYLQAYKRDGTFLWQMNMGYNSTNQYVYAPGSSAISFGDSDHVTVYDIDGDGQAEVLVKTANGVTVTNAAGVQVAAITAASDSTEYISVLNGLTGAEKSRIVVTNPFPADGPLYSRFIIAYADGVHPSLIFVAENRNKTTSVFQEALFAYDWRSNQIVQRWAVSTNLSSRAHQIRVADINRDGIDEICEIGSAYSANDGHQIYDNGLQHGDRYHIADMDPDRPGLETYAIQQLNPTLLATMLYDTATGTPIKEWFASGVVDVSRGVALDMDPGHKGYEMYSTQPGIFDCQGNQIYTDTLWPPEALWWDADLSREFEDGAGNGALSPVVNKYNPSTHAADRIYTIYTDGVHQAYGGRAAFWGDILGDWREELVLVASDYSEIRIYTTKLAATNRLYCLMQDPAYRGQSTAKGYYQASYPDYYLGTDMQPPPLPPVSDARLVWRGSAGTSWDAGSTANWFTNNLWISNSIAIAFNSGDSVLFDLTGSNNAAINLTGWLAPGAVTVNSPKDYIFSGNGSLGGTMSLTKSGGGKLTLNNTNPFTGGTLICESTVIVNGSLPNSPVIVRGGVWLDGRIGGNGTVGAGVTAAPGSGLSPGQGTNSPGTLTISNVLALTGSTVNDFDLSDDATGTTKTNDRVNVVGNLTLQGTNRLTIHKLNATLPAGTYPLIVYSGTLIGGLTNLAVAGLDGTPLALTNPPGRIALIIKSLRAPVSLVWTGGQNGNAWDMDATSNWLNGAAKDLFVPEDTVRFDNTGATNPAVNLAGLLQAGGVTVDSSSDYVFTGTGSILGAGSLTKTNSGTLTISNENTYSGPTIVGGGVLAVSDLSVAGSPGPLGSAPNTSPTNLLIYDGATLRFPGAQAYTDRGFTLASGTGTVDVVSSGVLINYSGLVTGPGKLQKIGAGTLILGTSNSYSGGTLIKDGLLQLATEAANTYGFGTGLVTLDGGILKMLDDSSTYSSASYSLYVPTNSVGALYCDSRIDFYGSLTGGGILNDYIPFSRTTLYGNWSQFAGKINILPGVSGDSRVGGTGTNGDFRINNTYGYGKAAIYLTNWMYAYHTTAATTVAVGELSGAPNAFLTAGAWQVGAKNTDATFAGRITGTSITKVGTGTWTLTGTNTYAGTTTVSAGTLLVNGNQLSATNTVTVASGATLGGIGLLGGVTRVNGQLSPGSNATGILTFTNNVTLSSGSTAYIELRKSTKTNDVLRILGRLTYGGTLQVTNLSGTLTDGDSFKIFDATNYTGAFAALSPATPGIGLGWNTNALYTNGTLAVITFVAPRFSNVGWTGTSLIMSGTGGSVNGYYYILATTNLALPLAQWTSIATNQFDASGNFNCTNSISAGTPQRFYLLQVP